MDASIPGTSSSSLRYVYQFHVVYPVLSFMFPAALILMSSQVGVFCSIVSTKIPFKGAGKEYMGDDIEEMVSLEGERVREGA
jgi:hypothetical protein